jgi:hypothetical protein
MSKNQSEQLFDVLLVNPSGQEEKVYGPCEAKEATCFVSQWLVDPLDLPIMVRPSLQKVEIRR